jgi:hypothetical protein
MFLSNLDYTCKCDEIIEFTRNIHGKDDRMIPDDYIELIKYWTGHHFYKLKDMQTYPDNWGCHDKEIISFVFKNRYCELSEMVDDKSCYMTVRVYPSNIRTLR